MTSTKTLHDGNSIPMLGLGTWKSKPGEVGAAVEHAIRVGYRHIDCASFYGNEAEVGDAIRTCIDEGVVKRDELWVTSKLWNNAHKREDVRPALESTLRDLKLDFLDLYLIHWPVALKPDVKFPRKPEDFFSLEDVPLSETWQAMHDAAAAGLTRSAGVSNFSTAQVDEIHEATGILPVMNQVELHPFLQQRDLVANMNARDVALTAYSPLGSSDRPKDLKGPQEPALLEHPVVTRVAARHEASPAQVLIAWAIARDTIVIPKSTNAGRIEDNLAAASLSLTEQDLRELAELDRGYRFVDGAFWCMEGSPYSWETFWG